MHIKDKIFTFTPSVLFLFSLLLLWEACVFVFQISDRVLPGPVAITSALSNNWRVIADHTLQTFIETAIGLAIATCLGIVIALFLDHSSFVRKTLYPLIVTSQTIPLIALAPLLLLWFGFGILPKIIMVVLYCFFPIAIATVSGLARTDESFTKLLKSMNASYLQSLRLVRFPQALPSFFAGLKIAATYAVAGAIVGEFVGGQKGLGVYMQTMANSYATTLVFAGVFVTILLSLLLFLCVLAIERFVIRW